MIRKAVLGAVLAITAIPGSVAAAPISVDMTVPGPQGPLAGTLLAADPADAPVVLILPGSGPTDRDGNSPMGLHPNSYRLLAEALAAKGVSAARIDKRGMFASKDAIADANKVTLAAYAEDARKWVRALADRNGARCVWIAGHSEGGLVALAAAQDPLVCGLILIATPGRSLDAVIREQLAANPANAPLLADADTALDALARGDHADVSGMHPALANGLFNPAVQDFLIDLIAHPPAPMIAAVDKPILIASGGSDLQVSVADADALAAAQPKAARIRIDGMSHTLKHVEGEGRAANMATYTDPDKPIEPRLVTAIVDFIDTHRGKE